MLELPETAVQQALDLLLRKHLVSDRSAGYGGRVTKYKHRFCNTDFQPLKFSPQELGVLCVLMLRGAQTPGELRVRTNRLCEFGDAEQVERTLAGLMSRDDGPFIARVARAPGAREYRYAHLFSGHLESVEETLAAPNATATTSAGGLHERVDTLERLVAELRAELDSIRRPPP